MPTCARSASLPLLLAALLSGGQALAEEQAPPRRTVALTVYGNDKCPEGAADEIVVCAREPESERYRIPEKFREKKKDDAASASWVARAETLDEVARPMRPGSCSVSGSFGQSGCMQEMLRRWFAERRQLKSEAAAIP